MWNRLRSSVSGDELGSLPYCKCSFHSFFVIANVAEWCIGNVVRFEESLRRHFDAEVFGRSELAFIEVSVGGVHFGVNNEFIPGTGYEGNFLVLSTTDINGTNIETAITNTVSVGDILRISNADGSKIVTFSVTVDPFQLSPDEIIIQVDATSINYTSSTDEGFAQGEQVTLTNTSASTGLAEDVEWNNFHYYHDHNDNDTEYCPVGGRHHFDFDYWNAGGLNGANCDIFSCPDQIYNSDYVYM